MAAALGDFNSIKVRLELRGDHLAQRARYYFNSIKVRLERYKSRQASHLPQFQFHKGTIRTFRSSFL